MVSLKSIHNNDLYAILYFHVHIYFTSDMMISTEETTDIEAIILNLKMISKIRQNDKLVIVNKTLHVDQRFLQPLLRWYTADNRHDTLMFISSVINQALGTITDDSTCKTNPHPVYDCNAMKTELMAAVVGIDNLSATYKLDNLIVSKIDILKNKILKLCDGTSGND